MVMTPLTCFAMRKAIEYINICFRLFFFKESVSLSQWNKWNNSQSAPSEILVIVDVTIDLALFPEKKSWLRAFELQSIHLHKAGTEPVEAVWEERGDQGRPRDTAW